MKRETSVLLIDDDQLYNQLQSIELQELKIWDKIICLESREEALSHLIDCISSNCLPEIIFMDLNMSSMSLEEFLNQINTLTYTTSVPRIVITSALFKKDEIQKLKMLGLDDFVTKPVTSEKICDIISKINGEVR